MRPSSALVHAKLDLWAVAPQPLQRVETPLVRVLYVHHKIEVIKQDPALLPITLPAYRFRVMAAERLLDAVDDSSDLALVGCSDHQKHIGYSQLLRNVVGNQIGAKLVDGRIRGRAGQLQRACGSGQNLSICRTICDDTACVVCSRATKASCSNCWLMERRGFLVTALVSLDTADLSEARHHIWCSDSDKSVRDGP